MRFRTAAVAAATTAAIAAATVTGGGTAQAAGSTGCVQLNGHTVCRTDPRGGSDTSIVKEIVRQIDRTGRGDTVRASVYQWTLERPVRPVAESLIKAKRRGVDVKVVIGRRGSAPAANNAVIAEFKDAGIAVKQCKGACLPNPAGRTKGPNHNRFFLIERDDRPTVITTSFNFTRFHTTQAHNLIAVHGDRSLHGFYNRYWQRLYKGSWKGWGERHKDTPGNGTHAWVFPRSADPIASQLKQVTGCAKGDRVWVAHANFQPNRPAVREQLGRIKRLGCDVKVVVLDKDTNSPSWIAKATGGGSVRVHSSLRDKFIVLDAEFNGKARQLVYTGTHNLNKNSMKNADDNLLRVGGKTVAGVYTDYFKRLWRGSARLRLAGFADGASP
ncbi:phospholipase D-like domain-containing protein [Glycomyces sp. L485]|uniref:phospholipase D-like domain-containing protein n=1 Tax=Glycomyces sp. L485 TaxID=2909235 RepID=UPI001F4AE751|nr:phospholipase D-like domain-containing protein [Glycomyces sp. L485]MCH7231133.1 phospholipase D-like domain-containing protein [Glycomyces sp. L485]